MSSDNVIESNVASLSWIGIHVGDSASNVIKGNTASSNDQGIYLIRENSSTIEGNATNSNRFGIYLYDSSDNAIENNNANFNNLFGIYVDGYSNGNIIKSNTANSNKSVGIHLRKSSDNTILYNAIFNNADSGVYVGPGCSNNAVHFNDIVGNKVYGVYNDPTNPLLDATNNWWGDASGPNDPAGTVEVPPCTDDPATEKNTDGTGDKVSDNVDYCPWAGAIKVIGLIRDLIEKADQEKTQVFKGLAVLDDALSDLESEIASLILDIERNMLDGNIAQSLADQMTKMVDENGRPRAPLLAIPILLSNKNIDLVEMDKLLEQANEYESEALAWLNTAITTCGGNAGCEKEAEEKALKALEQSIKLTREVGKSIWLIKDNIKRILVWICGFEQLVARASGGEITAEYRAELLSRARDLKDLVMDLLTTIKEEVFAPLVKVKDLKVEAEASLEAMLRFGSTSSLSSLVPVKLWAYAENGAIRFMALGPAIEGLSVQVFDLAGKLIFDSGLVPGNMLVWRNYAVANGVYLYIITVRGYDGQVIRSEVRKLVVLR
jgi:parallel beta-helix repeat protein